MTMVLIDISYMKLYYVKTAGSKTPLKKNLFYIGQLEIPVEKNGRMTQSMEMIPLLKSEAKDSLITLDYVSIRYVI